MHDSFPCPTATIGLIGGGQLGRMLVKAAKRLGCATVVLDPYPESPAGQLATRQIVGGYHDPDKLREVAEACDVLTFELEDIDAHTLVELAQAGHRIHPSPTLLKTVQDKLHQKEFLQDHGIATAEFVAADEPDPATFAEFGYPLVQKARRGGYDGRGVAILRSAEDFDRHLPIPSLLERFVDTDKEIGVMVARGADGESRVYPPVEMCFRGDANILDILLSPANISTEVAAAAERLALQTIEALEGIGVFGVELFLDRDGNLLVNEIAPRTHNSGHHTLDANITDQFEQHLRAILELPLGSTRMLSPAAMINLLGEPEANGAPRVQGLRAALSISGVCLHLYGKARVTPLRKMGHATIVDPDIGTARAKALEVRDLIRITAEEES